MSLSNFVDLVKINATTIGTGPFGLGAPLAGFQGVSALVDGRQYSYSVQQAGLFEFGKGTYSAGTLSLSRSPEGSSSGGAAVPFAAGAVVTFTLLASDLLAIAGATGAGGGVTSVDIDGGTTGMSFLNGPIVNSGTFVMTGVVDPSAGGTGQNSLDEAIAALLPPQTGESGKVLTTDGTVISWQLPGGIGAFGVSSGGTGAATFSAGILTSPGGTTPFVTVPAPSGDLVGTTAQQALTEKNIRYGINAQSGTTYTLVVTDARTRLVTLNNAAAITLTVPTDAAVAWAIGDSVDILQLGAGQVTVVGAGGVTVNGTPGLKLRAQHSGASLIKRAANTWALVGDLSI